MANNEDCAGAKCQQNMVADELRPKAATEATKKAHALVKELFQTVENEENERDFIDAKRDRVAFKEELNIPRAGSGFAWSLTDYANFITEGSKSPDTVNPSLWRQSKLNMYHGLFKVTDNIYQVRNYDISNITFVKGNSGWIVIDPLVSTETAKAALELLHEYTQGVGIGKLPVVGIVYSHTHLDHYGGIHGVVALADVEAGKVPVIAPQGFLEYAVSENVIAGKAMGRRAHYMYGALLPRNAQGGVGSGLGMTNSLGSTGLIPPTQEIFETGECVCVDGVEMVFQMTPGTEAPAEMNTWFPQFKALWMAENCCATMHNILTPRGAQVRDSLVWSKYIHETIELWGDEVEVRFQSHHWPMWGQSDIVEALEKQRDLYKFIHDQSVFLMNKGYMPAEISEKLTLPDALGQVWANHGYYGTLEHNSRAVYQRYMGWYSGHPADLNNLPSRAAAAKYVEYMGGAEEVLKKARVDFDAGNYRFVAEVLKHVVFDNPKNMQARYLMADTLEQLGYQAESGPWRNIYLQGAFELRHGAQAPDIPTFSMDTLKEMSPELIFDYMAIRLQIEKALDKNIVINIICTDTNKNYVLFLGNSVLNYGTKATKNAQLTLSLAQKDLPLLLCGPDPKVVFDQLTANHRLSYEGERESLFELLGMLEVAGGDFSIMTREGIEV